MHIHDLAGCTPQPLGFYLKALGVLRLLGEQADGQARGWWDGGRFRLATTLDRDGLVEFFLHRYEPTPLVAPWLKGSGFFQANDKGVAPLEASTAPRLQRVRNGIAASRAVLVDLAEADRAVREIKAEAKSRSLTRAQRDALKNSDDYKRRLATAERVFKDIKDRMIPEIRNVWRGPHREWMDAALTLDDQLTAKYPALLGTGGNDGRLDFTNNFMQRLQDLFDTGSTDAAPHATAQGWLISALWGETVPGYVTGLAIGQFIPGAAGGANSVNGAQGDSLLNPFDYVLMLEGSVILRASVNRQLDARAPQRAAAPFVAPAHAAGYASAAAADESARGEQWMPVWAQPMALNEVRRLFAEGRVQIGREAAARPLDFARAAMRMGVSRGITAFQRFGYIERNGQSNLAVPLGRFEVRDAQPEYASCLDDLASWMNRLHRESNGKDASARLTLATRRVADACFDAASDPETPLRWQELLLALGEVEAVMKTGSGFRVHPIPLLSRDWVRAADDGSPEFRLALSFALQTGARSAATGISINPMRRHWLPLGPGRFPRFAVAGDAMRPRLEKRADVVIDGRDGIADAIALISRQLIEAAQSSGRAFPLMHAPGGAASLEDLAQWLIGGVDANRTFALGRALMALDPREWQKEPISLIRPAAHTVPFDDGWVCIRLACLPWPLGSQGAPVCDPALIRRLASGDAAAALEIALRRLRPAGVRPSLRSATVDADTARRWAAALVFPISVRDAEYLLRVLDPSHSKEPRS